MPRRTLVTLGMFIIDTFEFLDENGTPLEGKHLNDQIGGGGTYCAIGARIWLSQDVIGMVVDRGNDFPSWIQSSLDHYGLDMWLFRDQLGSITTKAVNRYTGELRGFDYLTPRIRITPKDLHDSPLENSKYLHFICSPKRAREILDEVDSVEGWTPIAVFEPIPDRCVPEELPALKKILDRIAVLSPNAEEALSLLSLPLPPNPETIERAASMFLSLGAHSVVIRSGALGAYAQLSPSIHGKWISAYFTSEDTEAGKVVDVTGAGNAFLGGLVAGLERTGGDVYEACLYASVSSSFTIEQNGLPQLTGAGEWNGELPETRLERLKSRLA